MTQHALNTNTLGHQGAKAKTLAQGMVLLMLLSSLANLGIALVDYDKSSAETIEDFQQEKVEGWTSAPTTVGNYSNGGEHLVTGDWWEPKTSYIPSVTDYDGDGLNNSIDNAPFDRNSGSNSTGAFPRQASISPTFSDLFTPAWFEDDGSNYPMEGVSAIELADMDNDGDLDLIIGDESDLYISWNDRGTFLDPKDSTHGQGTVLGTGGGFIYAIKAADLDLDGDLDIVIGTANEVKVFEMESGALDSSSTLSLNAGSAKDWQDISIGDVDGDNYPEILVAADRNGGTTNDNVILMENDASTKNLIFTKIWSQSTSSSKGVGAAILTDWDADGYLDVIIGSRRLDGHSDSDSYFIYGFKSSAGTIPTSFTFATSNSHTMILGLAAADLNGDSYPELVASTFSGKTYVFNNRLDATTPYVAIGSGSTNVQDICPSKCHTSNIRIVDINNDNLGDLLLGASDRNSQGESHIYLHAGLGWANSTPSFNLFKTLDYDGYDDYAVGDLTGNGLPDLIYQSDASPIEIYRAGSATLTKTIAGNLTFINGSVYTGMGDGLISDYDNDGDLDVIALDYGGVHIFEQTSAGIEESAEPAIEFTGGAYGLNLIDVDRDDDLDLIVAHQTAAKAYLRGSDGTYSIGKTGRSYGAGSAAYILDVGSIGYWWASNTGVLIDGYTGGVRDTKLTVSYYSSGAFSQYWESKPGNSTTGYTQDVKMKDMNNDGKNDIVRCMANEIQIYNRTTTGSGIFLAANYSANPWVISVGTSGFCNIADVDGDGTMDIITKMGYNGRVILGPSYSTSSVKGMGYTDRLVEIQPYDLDLDGEQELVITRSTGSKGSVHEIDSSSNIGSETWKGGGRRNTKVTALGDIDGDGLVDMVQFNYMSAPEYILGLSDTDNDAVPDSEDDFLYDPTQKDDTDSDGYGSSNTGMLGDNCQYYWGDSTEDRRGCPDQDSDGWSDLNDAFWRDSTQWTDVDGDGLGDNATGNTPDQYIYDFDNDGFDDSTLANIGASSPYDTCKYTFGTSDQNNSYGCLDTDGDGWSNIDDKFSGDSTQWVDRDGDGFGDNNAGNLPDFCPISSGTSFVDVFGCIDLDGDGTSYLNDFNDNDSNEVKDSDNDTIGDNGDNCPYEWSNLTTTSDRGCRDLDGDGVADRSDDFQNDRTQWRDSDGDGRGDEQSGTNPDAFPSDPTQTDDSDDDGHGDNPTGNAGDQFPLDETQWKDTDGDGRGDSATGNNSDDFPTQPSQTDDSDNDGYGDNPTGWQADAFPLDETQHIDSDGDGYGDNPTGNNSDEFPSDSSQHSDTDGDGYGDNPTGWQADAFPLDETQHLDSDGDGYGDSPTGNNSDAFPSDETQYLDSDGDGHGDNQNGVNPDAFPNDNSQYQDSDGDGWGDNSAGNDPDQCPSTEGYSRYRIQDDGSTTVFYGCEDDDGDNVPNSFDDCQTSAGNSWIDRKACTDSDQDGISDQYDPYPYNASSGAASGDWDGDGVMDFRPGQLLDGTDVFPNDITQTTDYDGDGYGDNMTGNNADQCLTTPLKEKLDVDERGCAPDEVDDDNDGISNLMDQCPDSENNDNVAIDGCLDSDDDDVSNEYDAFPHDANETQDTDGDGIGNVADDCAGIAGVSWRDKNGCEDSDGDGYSNPGDQCPNLWGLADAPLLGCPDRDEDGVADQVDAFPDDRNETMDHDKDGIGDEADLFPNDHDNDGVPTNEDWDDFDPSESMDSDDDGVGDNADIWPDDPDVWSDGDGDGFSDQLGHYLSDDCPSIPGNSTKFQDGCSDIDGDGMPDVLDPDIDGDGITNDNEMDASSGDIEYDPFDPKSSPNDLDGDHIPDVLDNDIDGDGFPNDFENERGSASDDENSTPFNIYSDSVSGVYYVPGEGFKDNYDPDGYEISISFLINLVTSEFLIPLLIFPLSMFAMMRKGRRYKKINKRMRSCEDLETLKEFEPMIDSMIIGRKVKVEQGILLRNLFERRRDQMEDAPQMPKGGASARFGESSGGGRRGNPPQSRPGSRPGGQTQSRGGPRRPGM
ncbi:MAG TPA: hypothetical protein EYQ73_06140 [Candidatus Poseidoniales archaeon]|nr:hypothetical protein [Candidatus Poseidoniales archaeon]